MTVGFRIASGKDLDDVFEPYSTGAHPANTGYRASNGVDLAQRYAPRSLGGAAANTGYRIASGADLATLFAAKGSVGPSYDPISNLVITPSPVVYSEIPFTTSPKQIRADVALSWSGGPPFVSGNYRFASIRLSGSDRVKFDDGGTNSPDPFTQPYFYAVMAKGEVLSATYALYVNDQVNFEQIATNVDVTLGYAGTG